jgi:muramidase (phage lysozyme)
LAIALIVIAIVYKPANDSVKWAYRFLGLPVTTKPSLEANFKPDEDFNTPLKVGDKVLGYPVTSGFGKREKPCPSCSEDHKGVDIATPTGTPIYAIGKSGSKSAFQDGFVDVACPFNPFNPPEGLAAYVTSPLLPEYEIQLFHLNECYAGRHPVGSTIAKTGNSGASTGEHLHVGVKFKGELIDPPRGFVLWLLQGKEPVKAPTVTTPKIKAFLDTIRYAEGTDNPEGYKTIFTGEKFNDFSKHPDRVECSIAPTGNKLCSAAAGAYQYMPDTWERVSKKINAKDFSPENQERGAIELLKERGALKLIEQGRIEDALIKVCGEWASISCDKHSTVGAYPDQAVKPISELAQIYKKKKQGKK